MPNPFSCFDCTHTNRYAGSIGTMWDPPEPPEVECIHPIAADFQAEIGEDCAAGCPFFDPEMVRECFHCKAPINQPEYSWKLWIHGEGDALPVCSQACKEQGQDSIDREIEAHRIHDFNPDELYEGGSDE